MRTTTSNIAESLRHAFRAAYLLTGSITSAENAVLSAIASLEPTDNLAEALLLKTVAAVLPRRGDLEDPWEHAPGSIPPQLEQLGLLPYGPRYSLLLHVVLRIQPEKCAAILSLTGAEFQHSLTAAFQQLQLLRRTDSHQPAGASRLEADRANV